MPRQKSQKQRHRNPPSILVSGDMWNKSIHVCFYLFTFQIIRLDGPPFSTVSHYNMHGRMSDSHIFQSTQGLFHSELVLPRQCFPFFLLSTKHLMCSLYSL